MLQKKPKIAIIGGGISGLSAAYFLRSSLGFNCEIDLYEANSYIGGHTDTHHLLLENEPISVDTGFIVSNPSHYPLFYKILKDLNVATIESDMSLAVSLKKHKLEYGTSNLRSLFCQPRNFVNSEFYRMLFELKKFYSAAEIFLNTQEDCSLFEFSQRYNLSDSFQKLHLNPIAHALWSSSDSEVSSLSARHVLSFFKNHHMLQIRNRPAWRTIQGGSSNYIAPLLNRVKINLHTNAIIEKIIFNEEDIQLQLENNQLSNADYVIMACHSDQALKILPNSMRDEKNILSKFSYRKNEVVLHSDIRFMPAQKNAWSSWNVCQDEHGKSYTTYYMNLLQNLSSKTPLLVTVSSDADIEPKTLWCRRTYYHPFFAPDIQKTQIDIKKINHAKKVVFCGAYWGFGFHEDGVCSARSATNSLLEDTALKAIHLT